MKLALARKPFGTAKFERIRAARFHSWEDTFEVEFESGVSFLVSHADLRRANGLSGCAPDVEAVWVDPELGSGFFVRYADGTTAEASWEFVKENPPRARRN